MIFKFLCKIGLHWPRKKVYHSFVDRVTGESVFNGQCSCGKTWLYTSVFSKFEQHHSSDDAWAVSNKELTDFEKELRNRDGWPK